MGGGGWGEGAAGIFIVLLIFFSETSSVKIFFSHEKESKTCFSHHVEQKYFFPKNNTLTTQIQQLNIFFTSRCQQKFFSATMLNLKKNSVS